MTSSSSSSPIRPSSSSSYLSKLRITREKVFKIRDDGAEFHKSGNGDLFMSESEHGEHESELCDGGNGEEDDEKKKEEGGDDREVRRKEVFGISSDFRNAIKRPFRKKKKEKERGDVENVKLPSARRRGRRIQSGGEGGCYVCFLRPRTEESPETPTSDPNSETFSFEMLRTLIEKNDFYCKECNPHI